MNKLLTVLFASLLLAGCATTSGIVNPRDPYEGFNRSVFNFNDSVDKALIKPVVSVYTTVFPDVVRTGISNFFSNVGDVWVGVNNLLQGKPDQAASDVGRVLVNTTLGIGGFFDVATSMGLKHHNEDFGQTLGRWGFETGPYLVLPIFGPRDIRDSFGLAVDLYGNPIGYIHDVGTRNSLWGVSFLDTRANLNNASDLLDQAALDRYTFVRESYLQRRRNLVYDGDPPPLPPAKDEDDAPPPAKNKVSEAPALTPEPASATDAPAPAPRSDDAPADSSAPAEASAALAVAMAIPAEAVVPAAVSLQPVKPRAVSVVYPVAVPAIPDRLGDATNRTADMAALAKP